MEEWVKCIETLIQSKLPPPPQNPHNGPTVEAGARAKTNKGPVGGKVPKLSISSRDKNPVKCECMYKQ